MTVSVNRSKYCKHRAQNNVFQPFNGMERFGVYRLLAEAHGVTRRFVQLQMDRRVYSKININGQKIPISYT